MAATKLLVTDLSSGAKNVPTNYIHPISERPNLSDVQKYSDVSFPVVDLQDFHGPNHSDVIKQIAHACQSHGFFQLKNHGIPESVINNMLRMAREFIRLPKEERLKYYSDDPSKTSRLCTSFSSKTEKVSNWRDFLRLRCYPLENYINEWPSNPPSFRENVAEYCSNVSGLMVRLVEAISESLGLKPDHIAKSLGNLGQHMVINYYPPCSQPELTYGLAPHSDPHLLTILLQDDVPGLHVLRNANWIAIDPIPNTFIVNLGDQMQVLSNDRYKSVIHRAVVNSNKDRLSIPIFYSPPPEAVIGPAKDLIDHDHQAVYRSFVYSDYYRTFGNRGLEFSSSGTGTESCLLDMFKVA